MIALELKLVVHPWDSPGGSVARTLIPLVGLRFSPWSENQDTTSHATWLKKKKSLIYQSQLRSPGGGHGNPLSSILAWRVPWTEEPGGLQSIGSQRVGHNWSIWAHIQVVFLGIKLMWDASAQASNDSILVHISWLLINCELPFVVTLSGRISRSLGLNGILLERICICTCQIQGRTTKLGSF